MEKPTCKLIGEDGNVFNLLAIIQKALKKNGLIKEFKEMSERVFGAASYSEALVIFMDYVNIE